MKLADWSLLVILAQAQAKLACWETERKLKHYYNYIFYET